MSDETKIEEEDTEDVEGHGGKLSSGTVRFGSDEEDTEDVEAHGGKLSSRVVSQVRSADEAGDDDVQAHAHRLTS
jgi:hypothetical protein